MSLIKKIVLVNIFLMLLLPLSNYTYHASGRASGNTPIQMNTMQQTINNDTVIGSNASSSTYLVPGNLAVRENTTLKLINTNLEFQFNSDNRSTLYDNGSLILFDSKITVSHQQASGHSLNISVLGTTSEAASLSLYQSSLDINGSIYASQSNITALNSSISGSAQNSYVSEYFKVSQVLFRNSTDSGVLNRGPVDHYAASSEKSNQQLISSNTYISMVPVKDQFQNAKVNILNVSITYSGYTQNNGSLLFFNLSGTNVYTYFFNNTGSFSNKTTVTFSIPLNGSLLSSSTLLTGNTLTIYMMLKSKSIGTVISGLNVTFMSNDTVDYYGTSSFGPVFSDCTVYSVNSGFELTAGTQFLYSDVPNPMKNAIFAYNGTVFNAVRTYDDISQKVGVNSPFMSTNSSVFIYSLQSISEQAPEGGINGAVNHIKGNEFNKTLNMIMNGRNLEIRKELANLGIEYSNISSDGMVVLPLLKETINSSGLEYNGNYVDNVDSQSDYFSEPISPGPLYNSTNLEFNFSLPNLIASLKHTSGIIGKTMSVTTEVTSNYMSSGNLTLYLNVSGAHFSKFLEKETSLVSNITYDLNWNMSLPISMPAGTYNLGMAFNSSRSTFNTNSTLNETSIEIHSNVNLSIDASYIWKNGPYSVLVNTTVLNEGAQAANGSLLTVRFYSGNAYEGKVSRYLNITGNSATNVSDEFTSSAKLTKATLSIIPVSTVIPYNSSGENRNLSFNWNGSSQGSTPAQYYLHITSKGLPAGIQWSVEINNEIYSSLTGSVNVTLKGGPVSVNTLPVQNYHVVNETHSLNLTSNTTVYFRYALNTYGVTISEGGSENIGTWNLILNGKNYTVTGSSFSANLQNGTYKYVVIPPTGFSVKNRSGEFTVSGSSVDVNLSFLQVQKETIYAQVLGDLEVYSPVITFAAAFFTFTMIRSSRRSAYLCLNCGDTLDSRFGKCSCKTGQISRKVK